MPNRPDVIILGPLDSYLTIRAQQTRALNVAYAVTSSKPRDTRIAVVGAGIGGVTVASALVRAGFNVSVFERARNALYLMEEASHRWIHPNILDWPDPSSTHESAELPIFDWIASDAKTVTSRWVAEWQETQAFFKDR